MSIPGNCYLESCDFFVLAFFKHHASSYYSSVYANYFDIGKAFIGVPVLAFLVGLTVCWAVDGFRRSTAD